MKRVPAGNFPRAACPRQVVAFGPGESRRLPVAPFHPADPGGPRGGSAARPAWQQTGVTGGCERETGPSVQRLRCGDFGESVLRG